jgi:1-acyl-sn-glycerol-3-phosphate acyltransferase
MAIESGATIIPVGIIGSGAILPQKTWDFYLGKQVKINIGQPIDAAKYTLEQKEGLIKEVRAAIINLCEES